MPDTPLCDPLWCDSAYIVVYFLVQMPLYILKLIYSLLFWTDHFMHSCQEYTRLADLHPRVQERIEKLDPAEYSNMANPHNSSRYLYLVFCDDYILLWSSRLRLNMYSLGKLNNISCCDFVCHFWNCEENGLEKFPASRYRGTIELASTRALNAWLAFKERNCGN